MTVWLAWASFALLPAQAPTEPPKMRELYVIDSKCACVHLIGTPDWIRVEERTVRGEVFQVFMDRKSRQVIFRIAVGSMEKGEMIKYWHYGLTAAADFNNDGIQDFGWYGGDDTSESTLVFLSSQEGYRRLEIERTFERKWLQLTGDRARFGKVGGNLGLTSVAISTGTDTPHLKGEVRIGLTGAKARRVTVAYSDFVFAK